MNTMSREEEITLVEQMICETRVAMLEDRKDRLQLEAELNELERELTELLIPGYVREVKRFKYQ